MIELNALSKYQLSSLLLIFSFFVTFLAIPILINLAIAFNIVDTPDGKLKQHKKIIPYLGGLGIYLGFISSILLFFFINYLLIVNLLFLVGLTFLMISGLFDDLYIIKPLSKLIIQFVASAMFAISLLEQGHNYNLVELGLIIFWFMSIMNAINLIDIMDGLSSVCTLCPLIIFTFLSVYSGEYFLTALLLCLVGSIFAFFIFNKPPARIYMGDSGSLFIGGFLAYIPLLIKGNKSVLNFDNLAPFLVLMVPILELLALILIRSYKKIPFYLGSPDHFALYLLNRSWSKIEVLVITSLFSMAFGITCLLYIAQCINLWFLIGIFLMLIGLWIKIAYA